MSPRPQPYGLGTARGRFFRSWGPRAWGRPFTTAPPEISLVGATEASNPVTGDNAVNDDTLVMPFPSGIASGDLAIVMGGFYPETIGPPTSPSGWIRLWSVNQNLRHIVDYRVLTAGEPASYTWTDSQSAWGKGGVMIVLRGVVSVRANQHVNSLVLPTLNIVDERTWVIALSACRFGSFPNETYTASANLTILEQHASRGNRAYTNSEGACVAIEQNVPLGSWNGSFSHPQVTTGTQDSFAIALGPE